MANGWLRWIVGFLAALILASFGYTHQTNGDLKADLAVQLTRIEGKLDKVIEEHGAFMDRRGR